MKSLPHSPRRAAFTLVEILVVVAIISVMLGMTGMGLSHSIASQQLKGAAQSLNATLNYAALLAQKENKSVQLRFYHFENPEAPGTPHFRAWQIVLLSGINSDGTPKYRFLTDVTRLPGGIILSFNPLHNTLATLPRKASDSSDFQFGSPYTYCSYEVRPDGATTLPSNAAGVVTLLIESQSPDGLSLPSNFRSVTLNPFNSRSRVY